MREEILFAFQTHQKDIQQQVQNTVDEAVKSFDFLKTVREAAHNEKVCESRTEPAPRSQKDDR
jgi:uncharacterized phage-like protein YoqJ